MTEETFERRVTEEGFRRWMLEERLQHFCHRLRPNFDRTVFICSFTQQPGSLFPATNKVSFTSFL